MRFQGTLIKEQGVTFGIIVVKPHVLHNNAEAESMRRFGTQAFGVGANYTDGTKLQGDTHLFRAQRYR